QQGWNQTPFAYGTQRRSSSWLAFTMKCPWLIWPSCSVSVKLLKVVIGIMSSSLILGSADPLGRSHSAFRWIILVTGTAGHDSYCESGISRRLCRFVEARRADGETRSVLTAKFPIRFLDKPSKLA